MVSEICLMGEEMLNDKTDALEPQGSQSCYKFKASPAAAMAGDLLVTVEIASQSGSVETHSDFTK